jgi:TolA-binding protein
MSPNSLNTMRAYIFSYILITLLSVSSLIKAQETTVYAEKNIHFKNGLMLIEEKKFSAAQQEFELLYNYVKKPLDNDQYTLKMYAEFYYGFCSYKLKKPNTERLFLNFINNYHETNLRSKAHFYLGNHYFENNKTKEAIEQYEKLNVMDLEKSERIEYRFNLGYAYFKRKDFDSAKPMFKEIKNVQGKFFEPANYYYGFISFYEEDYREAEASFELLKDSKLYGKVVPYYLTQIYFMRGDFQKVINYTAPLLSDPELENYEEVSHIAGQAYFELQQYKEAVPLLKRYIDQAKQVSSEEMYQLAYAQYKIQDYTNAIKSFKQLNIVEDSLGQSAMYALADCYLKTGNKPMARDAFQKAARLSFDKIIEEVASFMYAKLSLELDFTNIAINALIAFIDKYPNSIYKTEATELLSTSLLVTRNYAKAIEILEKANVQTPTAARTYQAVTLYRAVELFNDMKYDEALVLVNKSLQRNLDSDIYALAMFLKGNILFEKQNYAAAITEFAKFKQTNVKNISAMEWATKDIANYYIAYSNFKLKNYAEASTYFEETIQALQKTTNEREKRILRDAYLRNADCLFMTRNYTRALRHYDEVINNKWPGTEYALMQKSIIYGLQDNQTAKIESLRKLLNEYPNSVYAPEAHFELGNAFLAGGNLQQAASKFEEFTAKYQGNVMMPEALLKLGLIYFNLQNENKSMEAYKKVVKLYPNSEEAKEALTALRELYVNQGRASDYIKYVETEAGITISVSEQDSLLFKAAEKKYLGNDCEAAIKGFDEYLRLFPTGFFRINAHYFRGDCYFRAKSYAKALADFRAVIDQGLSRNYEIALLRATFITYEIDQNIEESNRLYLELYRNATLKSNKEVAIIGLMRTFFKMNKFDEVIRYSNEVLADTEINEQVKTEATFYKAKALFENKKYKESKELFAQLITKIPISSIKAESAYHIALIEHLLGEYQKSLDNCFAFNSEYASYEYWIVRNFILIADNYAAQNNFFQAKATLQSIIDNYKGDQKLIDEAKAKLDKIIEREIESSKVRIGVQESDTIEFDNKR